jgi:hypothetical protein
VPEAQSQRHRFRIRRRLYVYRISKSALKLGACSFPLLLSGCQQAPLFNIFGSFFPDWIFCIANGILLSAAMRLVFVRMQVSKDISAIMVYPCLAAFFAFSTWLIFCS